VVITKSSHKQCLKNFHNTKFNTAEVLDSDTGKRQICLLPEHHNTDDYWDCVDKVSEIILSHSRFVF
jgi:hypothetical protein